MKAAIVLIEFNPPISKDGVTIERSEIKAVHQSGAETVIVVGPEAVQVRARIAANSNVTISATTYATDGKVVVSDSFEVRVGSLEGPNPITNFRSSVVGETEVADDAPVVEFIGEDPIIAAQRSGRSSR